MFGNNKVKKLKSLEDVYKAVFELEDYAEHFTQDIHDRYHAERLLNEGLIDETRFMKMLGSDLKFNDIEYLLTLNKINIEEYVKLVEEMELTPKETLRSIKSQFIHDYLSYDDYMKKKIEMDRNEELEKLSNRDTVSIGYESDGMEAYAASNIEYHYQKSKLLHSFRMGKIDFYEYEVEMATLNNEPYVTVIFSPIDYENTAKLSVDARFNDEFINDISKREEYTPKYDENEEIIGDELVEQWFHTAVIVMAANMLKETDLDIFRSVSEDNPAVPLIEKLQFDNDDLDDLSDIEKEQIKNIEEHGRIYR